MSRTPQSRVDPLEHQIEQTPAPGEFIRDGGCHEFISNLEQIAERIDVLIDSESGWTTTRMASATSWK